MPRRVAALLVGAVLVQPAAAQGEARSYMGLEAGYSRGDFGTGRTSRLYSAVFSAGVVDAAWDAGLSLPYHGLDTEGTDTEAGPGDLILHAGHDLLPEAPGGLSVYGSGAVKLPTADEDAGLGTGEADVGGFLSLRQRSGAWQASASGGYTVIGDPPGIDYNNVVSYGVQATRFLTGAAVYAGLEGRTALSDAGDDPLEAYAGGFRLLPGDRAVTFDAFVGLSDGSADFGVRVGAVQWF